MFIKSILYNILYYLSMTTMNDTPIYIINLDRRPDRWEKTKNEMILFSNKYTRFSGIDTGNTIGCASSYFKLLEECSYIKQVMIFQDDLKLFDYSREVWENGLKDVPNDWDIIVSGVHFANIDQHNNPYITKNVVKLLDFSGLQMAMIKPSILQFAKKWDQQGGFDRYLGKLASKNLLNIYCIIPFCSIQVDGFSDLRHRNTTDNILFKKYEYYLCNYKNYNTYNDYKYSL